MKTITLTVSNRPIYTREVIDSLRENDTRGYTLFIAAEPGCEKTLAECGKVDFMPVEVVANPERLGVNFNNKNIYDCAFASGSEFNVAIEDDTPLSPDALDLANWFFNYDKRDDYLLLNLFHGSRAIERALELFEFHAFCPWGFCLTQRGYREIIRPNWMCDEKGWDWSICKLMREQKHKSLSPFLSRSRNIGKYGGVYCTPEYHQKCFSGHVSSSGRLGAAFRISNAKDALKSFQGKLFCITAVRNEEKHLPGLFDHIRDYVDGFIVVDDSSTDRTRQIIRAEPQLAAVCFKDENGPEHFRDSANHFKLWSMCQELGGQWAIYLDADERVQESCLKELRDHCRKADERGLQRITLRYRELWDGSDQYRADGIWGQKERVVLFRLPTRFSCREAGELHAHRNPPELDREPFMLLHANLYHLKMVNSADRTQRRQKFERLDPNRKFQPLGYDYLDDETGLLLERIPQGMGYRGMPLVENRRLSAIESPVHSNESDGLALSVVMPYYKRYAEFREVLQLNQSYLAKSHIEVILCLDEDSELHQLLDLIESYPFIQWKVIVNHEAHEWRPPCKALNVGIRHASGKYLLVVSPESAFLGDLPEQMLLHVGISPNAAICGRLNYCLFSELKLYSGLYEAMIRFQRFQTQQQVFYGSICMARETAIKICGYDECFTAWGGDDDNLRARLKLAGTRVITTTEVNIVHLSYESRNIRRPPKAQSELDAIFRPADSACPNCSANWGRAFCRVVKDWAKEKRSVHRDVPLIA